MRIQIIGDRLAGARNMAITSQVRGSDSTLVPGVLSWDAVATRTLTGDTVTISSDITTEETVSSGDYVGTPVTQEFISGYILGAAEYWLTASGDMFLPTAVVFPDDPANAPAGVAATSEEGAAPTA